MNGLRIKTDATATGSTVNGITFTNNQLSGITQYGVIFDQSYPSTLGTPGTGVILEVSDPSSYGTGRQADVWVSSLV